MARPQKMTREELEARLKREREFREILQRGIEVDRRLAAERRQQQQR
jgi:hypothetical protein